MGVGLLDIVKIGVGPLGSRSKREDQLMRKSAVMVRLFACTLIAGIRPSPAKAGLLTVRFLEPAGQSSQEIGRFVFIP